MNRENKMKETNFTENQEIEIPGHFTNLHSWYTAKVIQPLITENHIPKLIIEYHKLTVPQTSTPLRETITDLTKIRPKPPEIPQKSYLLNQIVDAFFAKGWWKGEIVGVEDEGLSYIVLLDKPSLRFRQILVKFGDMRLHQDWVAGKWVIVTPNCMNKEVSTKHHQGGVRITDEPQHPQACSSFSKYSRRKHKIKQSFATGIDEIFLPPAKKSDNRETTEGSCSQIAHDERKMTTRSMGELSTLTSIVEETPQKEATECSSPPILVVETKEGKSSEVDQNHIIEIEQEELTEIRLHFSQENLEINSSSQWMGDKEIVWQNKALDKPQTSIWNRTDPCLVKCSMNLEQHAVTRGQSYKASEGVTVIFTKSFSLWKYIESLEAFRRFPQDPHFRFLKSTNEILNEGEAIGYMLSFASIVDKTQRAQPNEPRNNLENKLEALTLLEDNGFNVEKVRERIEELLRIKDTQVRIVRTLKQCQEEIAKEIFEEKRLEAEIEEVDEKISELQGLIIRKSVEMEKKIKDFSVAALEKKVQEITEKINSTKHEFGLAAAAPW